MQIIPAILTDKFSELEKQIKKVEGLFPYAQIDIMDGEFVPNKSFAEVEKISELKTDLKFELHLMVNDPVAEMKKWLVIPNVFRIIVHLEIPGDVEESWTFAKEQNWEFGLALNPDTDLRPLQPHLNCIDSVLFMTVYPGRQGAPFEEKVIPKIKEFSQLKKRPLCTIDGGINRETIKKFKGMEIDVFNVGSALVMAEDVEMAKKELEINLSS